jgi:MFS family permease
MAGGVAAVIINPLAGKLSDKFGRKTMILWSCLGFAGVLLAVPLLVVHFWLAHLFFFLAMATASMRIAPFQSLLSALVPARQRGTLLSLTSAFGQTGFALGRTAAFNARENCPGSAREN